MEVNFKAQFGYLPNNFFILKTIKKNSEAPFYTFNKLLKAFRCSESLAE
jgi:hypothetical protein